MIHELDGIPPVCRGVPTQLGELVLRLLIEGRDPRVQRSARPLTVMRPSRNRDAAQTLLPRAAFRPVTITDRLENLVPRNAFYGDGLRKVDMALSKVFRLPWSGDDLAVRIEAFNVFNQVQFGFPNTDINSGAFGTINTVATSYSPRVLQFVMRYRY